MNQLLQNDLNQLDAILEKTKQQGLSYTHQLNTRPTSTRATITKKDTLNPEGLGALGALEAFNERLEPLMVASSGPRYWGFVTGGSTPGAIVGDWLATVYDQNTQSENGNGDNSAKIELETIQLLLDLLELPKEYLGGFVTGATMSNFTALAVGRQWLGKQKGIDIAKEGVTPNLKVLTATPHSSALKSLALLGMGSNNFIKIKVVEGNREAIDPVDLEQKIMALEGAPFILISSGGTVNTVDFDDFEAISKLREKYAFWWHIDAAFGGFAACSPSHKHLLKGWEGADSITVDCHKWLNVPYESAVFFIKEKHRKLQVETFQNSNAPYLGDPLENFTYLNFLPENSRRLKALPAWFSLMAYGKNGYRDIVENNIQNALQLGAFVETNPLFEILAPVRLNTVCFSLAGTENQENVNIFLKKLNDTGKVFMTPTVYNGKKGIRAAFVNWRTSAHDIVEVTQLMETLAKA
ncbi:pyridoxal phosphate-dependent decarboxylase family protein [Flavobacterium sp.]|uniref:pyridoxal phosphate-dependent decarboxylase family protein n=1 Tax=Flavobacterium sp. TaxID=239 RepID=UPI002FDE32DA